MAKKSKHVLVMMQPMSDLRFAGIARFAQTHGWFLSVEERLERGAKLWRGDGALVTLRNDRRMVNVRDWTLARNCDWDEFLRWIRARLGDAPRPLGVLTYDESDAARFLNACLDLGVSIPDEVSILAIGNDFQLCERQPIPISDIEQNMERGGFAAAALLDRLMNGGKPPKDPILIPPTGIVLRKSTDVVAASDPHCREALRYIADNLSRPFGAQEIADALKINRNLLDSLFRKDLGSSVGTEIKRQRLARVKKLLAETNETIDGIAADTGFCNASYLIATFRKAFSTTPFDFRRSIR